MSFVLFFSLFFKMVASSQRIKLIRSKNISDSGSGSGSDSGSFDLTTKSDHSLFFPDGWKSIEMVVTKSQIVVEDPTGVQFKTPRSLQTYIKKKGLPYSIKDFVGRGNRGQILRPIKAGYLMHILLTRT